jgi:hypothetical protein
MPVVFYFYHPTLRLVFVEAVFSVGPSSYYCAIIFVEVIFEGESSSVIKVMKFVCQYLERS